MSENAKTCFVIFPFKEPYRRQFKDTYKSALEDAGLVVEIADAPGADKITEEIEAKIRKSHICFADITEDNPNVWYEMGFAHACYKKVVTVCNEDERKGDLPFDVSTRHAVFYSNIVNDNEHARRGFKAQITDKAKEYIAQAERVVPVSSATPSVSLPHNPDEIVYEDLTRSDMEVLKIIASDTFAGKCVTTLYLLEHFQESERLSLSIFRITRSVKKFLQMEYIKAFESGQLTMSSRGVKFAENNVRLFD